MRVLVAGGTGFIGAALVESLLEDQCSVTVLGRDQGRIRARFGNRVDALEWGEAGDPDLQRQLSGHEVIFNFAGEQAVGRRYTPGSKQRIRDSRVKTTRALVEALSLLSERPRLLISASAVGYYGGLPEGYAVDETAPSGQGFLAELCHEWEDAALRAELRGIRVIVARLGVVLGSGGGAFEAMAQPFRRGLGGHLGEGSQDFSFISLEDCVQALRFCMGEQSLHGPVNLTAPAPTTSKGLAVAMGRVLGRPNWLPVPKFALKLLLGEGAASLLEGQRVLPSVLEQRGFHFQHPTIDLAVLSAAGNSPRHR